MNAWTHQKVSAAFSPQQYLKLRQECTSFLATIALIFSIGCGAAGSGDGTPSKPQNPTANAGGPYRGNVGQAIAFDGSRSAAPDGQSLSFAWDFGDDSTGTGNKPTHTYTKAGKYRATLTVNASRGSSSKATAAVTINGIATADAGGPYTNSVGQSITFDGSKSTAPSGQSLTYAWCSSPKCHPYQNGLGSPARRWSWQ